MLFPLGSVVHFWNIYSLSLPVLPLSMFLKASVGTHFLVSPAEPPIKITRDEKFR